MEDIVNRVRHLNFKFDCDDILKENRGQNVELPQLSVAVSSVLVDSSADADLIANENCINNMLALSRTPIVLNMATKEVCETDDIPEDKDTDLTPRRRLPMRACKENCLQKLQHRKPMKASKRIANPTIAKSRNILEFYVKQTLSGFRPSGLETIFEEPDAAIEENFAIENTQFNFVGERRVRRSLKLGSGSSPTKVLVKQRRAKIKKFFGRRSAPSKYPLGKFIKRMQKAITEDDDEANESLDEISENDIESPDCSAPAKANISSEIATLPNVVDEQHVLEMMEE